MTQSRPGTCPAKRRIVFGACARRRQRYIAANPESAKLNARSPGHLPGGNTRTTVHFSPFPLYIAQGKGSRLTDVDGHSYIDFINEYTAGVFGHSNAGDRRGDLPIRIAQGINFGAPTRT